MTKVTVYLRSSNEGEYKPQVFDNPNSHCAGRDGFFTVDMGTKEYRFPMFSVLYIEIDKDEKE